MVAISGLKVVCVAGTGSVVEVGWSLVTSVGGLVCEATGDVNSALVGVLVVASVSSVNVTVVVVGWSEFTVTTELVLLGTLVPVVPVSVVIWQGGTSVVVPSLVVSEVVVDRQSNEVVVSNERVDEEVVIGSKVLEGVVASVWVGKEETVLRAGEVESIDVVTPSVDN